MKKLLRAMSALLLLSVLLSTFAIGASAETISGECGKSGGNVIWSLDTDTGSLTISGTGEMKDFQYRYGDVSSIPWASRRDMIRSVEIQDGVTSVGSYAFFECTSLTSINLPSSLIRVGDYALSDCTALTSLTVPKSVLSIGTCAFYDCPSLTSISVAAENTSYRSAGNCLIEIESKTLVLGCVNSTIPSDGSVARIGDYAFFACADLTEIVIPNGVTAIGNGVFSGCEALCDVRLPSSVTTIGNGAFSSCKALTQIVLPRDLEQIGNMAFALCGALESVEIPRGVTSIGMLAFRDCKALKTVINHSSLEIVKGADTYGGVAAYADRVMGHSYDACRATDDDTHKQFCACGADDGVALAHVWDAGEITLAPTESEEGERTYTCVDCEATKTEKVAKLPLQDDVPETETDDDDLAKTDNTDIALDEAPTTASGCGASVGAPILLMTLVAVPFVIKKED